MNGGTWIPAQGRNGIWWALRQAQGERIIPPPLVPPARGGKVEELCSLPQGARGAVSTP